MENIEKMVHEAVDCTKSAQKRIGRRELGEDHLDGLS